MKWFKFGLVTKYTLAVAAVLILITLTQSLFLYQLDKIRAELSLKEHAVTIAKNLAYSCEYGILTKNTAVLKRLAESVAQDKEITYLQILDHKGNVLVQIAKALESRIPVFNVEYPVKTLKPERSPEEVSLLPLTPVEKVAKEEIIGNIKLGMSHAEVMKGTQRVLAAAAILTLALLAAGFLGIYMSSKYILVVPLKQFALGAERVARGDLDYKIEIKSEDEVGELAASFNAMTAELKKSREEIEQYTKNLEQQVKERTKKLEETIEKLKQTTQELELAKTGLEAEVAKRTAELEKERASLAQRVAEKTAELQEKLEELQIFHDAAVGRELKMMEMEKEIETLKGQLKGGA